jgi:hypothetical protein
LAAVALNGEYGYVDASGELAIPIRFSFAHEFSEGLALVKSVRFGYIDKRGEYVVPPRFEAGHRFSKGVAAVKRLGRWGYIDAKGDWLA